LTEILFIGLNVCAKIVYNNDDDDATVCDVVSPNFEILLPLTGFDFKQKRITQALLWQLLFVKQVVLSFVIYLAFKFQRFV
jgi:hypothetical protein